MAPLRAKQKYLLRDDISNKWTLPTERSVVNLSPTASNRRKHVKEIMLIEPTKGNRPSPAKQKRNNPRGLVEKTNATGGTGQFGF